MAKTPRMKKRRLAKKSASESEVAPSENQEHAADVEVEADSGSGSSDSESEPEELRKLLEPYSRDQLVDLICDAASRNRDIRSLIRAAADRDVSHRKVFVHGLGWDATRDTLASAFEPFGEIEDCNVVMDRVTGKSKGYGFVLFASRKGAVRALRDPRKKIGNRVAFCQLASVGPTGKDQDTTPRKIYVTNVPADADAQRLRSFFSKFGEIELGPLGFDSQTGKSKGFALFVYKTVEGAKKALEEPHKFFEGRQLHCQKAADSKNKNSAQEQDSTFSAVAAAQNLALLGQHPGLNPLYGGFLANPGSGFVGQASPLVAGALPLNQGVVPASQVAAGSSVGYGAVSRGLAGIAGTTSSVLGQFSGSTPSSLQGLQHVYPGAQIGQGHGAGTSFSGYPSYI